MGRRTLGWSIGLTITLISALAPRALAAVPSADPAELASPATRPADVFPPEPFSLDPTARSIAQDTKPDPDSGLRVITGLRVLFGQADGFVQTPSGGQPGTSSAGRPTLEELGIDDVTILDGSLTLALDDHEFTATGQWMRLTGDATLDEPLISQGQLFPAGSHVDAELAPNWYTITYGHRFIHELGRPGGAGDQAIILTPAAGLAIVDIDYELRGDGGVTAHRHYIKPSPLFGLAADYHATERLTLGASVRAAVPISSGASILAVEVEARYRFLEFRSGGLLEGVIGVGYEHLDYDDARKQELPNHVDVELGPVLILGLRARF